MNNPKISVIVPIVKAKYLEKCIRSITCQTYSNLEIICVMANSDELNSLLIEDLKNTDNRIKTIQALNSDKGSILSNGLSIANGDYIAFINPDDWLLLTLFETFVEDLNRFDKTIDIYMFNLTTYVKGANDIMLPKLFKVSDWNNHSSKYSIQKFNDCQCPFNGTLQIENKIFRKDFLNKHNLIFDNNLYFTEQIFSIKALLAAKSIMINDNVFYRYRYGLENIDRQIFDIFKTIDMIENLIRKNGEYDNYKYALIQFKWNSYVKYYKLCSDSSKESYFNEMKFRLLSAKTPDLNADILSHLKNYDLFNLIKNSPRKTFDSYLNSAK